MAGICHTPSSPTPYTPVCYTLKTNYNPDLSSTSIVGTPCRHPLPRGRASRRHPHGSRDCPKLAAPAPTCPPPCCSPRARAHQQPPATTAHTACSAVPRPCSPLPPPRWGASNVGTPKLARRSRMRAPWDCRAGALRPAAFNPPGPAARRCQPRAALPPPHRSPPLHHRRITLSPAPVSWLQLQLLYVPLVNPSPDPVSAPAPHMAGRSLLLRSPPQMLGCPLPPLQRPPPTGQAATLRQPLTPPSDRHRRHSDVEALPCHARCASARPPDGQRCCAKPHSRRTDVVDLPCPHPHVRRLTGWAARPCPGAPPAPRAPAAGPPGR